MARHIVKCALTQLHNSQPEIEQHTLLIGLELTPLDALVARKAEHDAEKRDRAFWSKELLLQANRMPDASNPNEFVHFAHAVARDCVDYLGELWEKNARVRADVGC